MRYNLRSHKQVRCSEPRSSPECPGGSASGSGIVRRKKTSTKSTNLQTPDLLLGQKVGFHSMQQEVVLMIVDMLDVDSILSLLRTSKWLYSLLSPCDSLWKMLCIKTELANYSCLETQPGTRQLGWAGMELHNTGVSDKAATGGQSRVAYSKSVIMRIAASVY